MCLKAEATASEAIRSIDEAVDRERALADHSPRETSMEMFVIWLERARAERLAAVASLASAEAQTATARAVVAAARSAARVVEYTIEERADVARAEAEKRDQHAMDDISRGRHGADAWSHGGRKE
jgi:hypothetical protein